MLSLLKTSLINTRIAKFYKIKDLQDIKNIAAFFKSNGSFNSIKIVEYLWPNMKCDEAFEDLQKYKYEDYLHCTNKLLPIFNYTSKIYEDFNKNSTNVLKLQWLGNNVNSYLHMKNSYNNNKTESFEHTLILTSLLANAITNVYLSQTKAKHAPHLLKDLIISPEIINVFGLEMIILLKILMGSPQSINLRNIVWHGFPKPTQIPNYYVNVLLIIIHSLGCIIEMKGITTINRNQIISFNEHITVIEKNFQLKPMNLDYIEEKIRKFEKNYDFTIYWQQLLIYYKLKKYKEFIMLVLPQIELLLRLHYGTVNNCDISAKLDEYYITIESIFRCKLLNDNEIEQSSNKLLDFDSLQFEGCFHLIYDLFLSPSGCRLRDKVSHGEVLLESLNNQELCTLVCHIFFVLLFPEEFSIFENYESKLHLYCITKVNLTKGYEKIKSFCSTYQFNNEDLPFISLTNDSKVYIFKRPKKEPEFVLLMNRIGENIYKTILNYEECMEIRSALLAQRELHSQRRKTFEKLQTALPRIFNTLLLIIVTNSKIFTMLQKNSADILESDDDNCDKTLRFLKHCLALSQNFLKHSHCDNNEWIKSLQLCRKYNEIHKKLYLYDD